MKEERLCPHCGFDLKVDSPVMLDDFSMDGAGYPLLYKGRPVKLTHGEALICWALMKAYPDFVTLGALLGRISVDGDNEDTIRTLICRLRQKLRDISAGPLIETVWGRHAYRWSPQPR